MRLSSVLLCLLLVSTLAAQAAPASGGFLVPGSIDPQKILPEAPAATSLVQHAEIEVLLNLQRLRTPEQVAFARKTQNEEFFAFGRDVLGGWFTAANLPKTAAFFAQLQADFAPVGKLTKQVFNRQRPHLADPRIKPCVEFSNSSSYPSGHAAQAALWAGLLSEIFPDDTARFADRAAATRWARLVGGAHYPTDVEAGRVLGEFEVLELLKNPAVQKALAELQEEAAPFLRRKAA